MSEQKVVICCGDSENLCHGLSCSVEEADNGFTIKVTSDDPKKVADLKAKLGSCCGDGHSKSCC